MKCKVALQNLRSRAAAMAGFTLVELMITVAIVAILAAVAIPSYRNYNMRANRSLAAQLMLAIQNREEQYILDARAYTNVLGSSGLNVGDSKWACTPATATTCTGDFYTVTVTVVAGTPPTYTITATPIAGKYQVSDGTLTLTSAGAKSRSAGDGLW